MDFKEDVIFFSNACQICRAWGKDAKLKTCAQCTLIAYCSREHQKEHWPRHKEFCQAFSKEKKCTGVIYTAYQLEDTKNGTNVAWNRARIILCELTQAHMSRELSNYEKQMVLFSKSCEICHETDPSKLKDCNDCPDASFCVNHPKDSKHSTKCQKGKLRFEVNTMVPNNNDKAIVAIASVSQHGTSVPANMDEAIEQFFSHPMVNRHLTSMKIYSIIISDRITKPYTFLYAIQKISCPVLQKMTIHVIVRSVNDIREGIFWQNLLHHNLQFKEIKISHVGPYLSSQGVDMQLCDTCVKNGCRIIFENIGDTYARFARSPFFSKPDFIVAFNLALNNEDELAPTVRLVSKMGCPFFMTTFLAHETEFNEERINLFLGKTVKPFWTGINPFAGKQPHKDSETDDFYYRNQYLTIYKKFD